MCITSATHNHVNICAPSSKKSCMDKNRSLIQRLTFAKMLTTSIHKFLQIIYAFDECRHFFSLEIDKHRAMKGSCTSVWQDVGESARSTSPPMWPAEPVIVAAAACAHGCPDPSSPGWPHGGSSLEDGGRREPRGR